MTDKKYFTVEEILHASEKQESFNASVSSVHQLVLSTQIGVTLGLNDVKKVNRLIKHIEFKYDVKMNLCGGGYGCTKLNFEVEGGDSAIELSKKLLRDIEFRKLAKDVGIDLVITLKEKKSIGPVDDKSYEKPPVITENKQQKRISSDGTIQNVSEV